MAVYGPVRHQKNIIWTEALDKKYNIANSSCHFGSYGSIWTGSSPTKYYMDRRIYLIYLFQLEQ